MKKSSKSFILIGATTIAIGIGTLFQLTVPMNGNVEKEDAKTYSHTTSNILDNTFLDGNNIILPFIFDNPDNTIVEENVRSEFAKRGLTVKNISIPDKGTDIGTGTKITVEENSNVYNVIVYGDVDGDGIVDLIDAQNIILHYLEEQNLTGFKANAAKVSDRTDEINLIDAQRVILFYLGSPLDPARLVVDEPVANNGTPVIKLNGNNNVKVKYGATYNDAGVTVTDISDKNIKAQTTGKIDTKKLGKQTIIYTAKNFSGKDATATRTVEVVDYVQKIEITKPNKTIYKYGEKLDLTGGKITLVKASGDRTTTIDMTSDQVKATNYDSNGKVTVTYTYKDPVTNVTTNISSAFSVTVRPLGYDEAPVITLKGKQNDIVKYKGTYTDLGVTVTDAIDKNLAATTTGKIDTTVLGKQTITYKATNSRGKVTTAIRTVEVVDYVKSIKVTNPSKTVYTEGEKLDKTGGKVILVKATGDESEKIDMTSSKVTVSNYDSTGKVTVTYPYKDPVTAKITNLTATFNVTLNYIKSIEIQPAKTKYEVGDSVTKDGMKIMAVRKDGTKEEIPLTDVTVTLPQSAALNDKTITAKYVDKIGKTHTTNYEIEVLLKPISAINIKTQKVIGTNEQGKEILEATANGDLRSTFKLTLTQKSVNEENIPKEKINWTITDSSNAVVASKESPNNNFEVTIADQLEQQVNGMKAPVMYLKILTAGVNNTENYKVTINLEDYTETAEGTPVTETNVEGNTNIEITKSEEVNKIVLDGENTVLSVADANGLRTLNKKELVPIKFIHIYPDGVEEAEALTVGESRLNIDVKSEKGETLNWISAKAYEDISTPATNFIGGIKFTASKTGTIKMVLKVGKITQEYKIKIDKGATLPLLETNAKNITFYSKLKPGNDLVKPYEWEDETDDTTIVSLIPIGFNDEVKNETTVTVPRTPLYAKQINSVQYSNTVGDITIGAINKDGSENSGISILLYDTNNNLIQGAGWQEKQVGYIGIYVARASYLNKLIGGNITIKYKIPNITDTQEINVKVMGEVTAIAPTVTDATVENNTLNKTLRPYGVFELVLNQSSLDEEDILIEKLNWSVIDTKNGNNPIATGKGKVQNTGNDYIELIKAPSNYNTQDRKTVKMSFKVLKTGEYKITSTLDGYDITAEMNFNVEEDKRVDGFILDKDGISIKKKSGTENEYTMPQNVKIPINYTHQYIDEQTGKPVEKQEIITNAGVTNLQVKLKDFGEENWVSYKLYYDEDTGSGELGINLIELNANKAGTVTLELTLNGITKTYIINIEETAANKPLLEVSENGTKIDAITLYSKAPTDGTTLVKTVEDPDDGSIYYYSLIPIKFTDNSRLKANQVNFDSWTTGKVTIKCFNSSNTEWTGISVKLYDVDKNEITLANTNWSNTDVGYIGCYISRLSKVEGGRFVIECKDDSGNVTQEIPLTINIAK